MPTEVLWGLIALAGLVVVVMAIMLNGKNRIAYELKAKQDALNDQIKELKSNLQKVQDDSRSNSGNIQEYRDKLAKSRRKNDEIKQEIGELQRAEKTKRRI